MANEGSSEKQPEQLDEHAEPKGQAKEDALSTTNRQVMEGEPCPICHEKTLTLMEEEADVPYFGKVFVFGMTCSNCKYHKADVECAERRDPVKQTIEINSEEDMKIRIVKSSEAIVKIPHVITITPGPASEGYVTNVEGLLLRVKAVIEQAKNDVDEEEEGDEAKTKAKNLLKKLQKVMWGQEKLTITIEDPSGNSAIISDKTVKK